jgi:hypothetical protein
MLPAVRSGADKNLLANLLVNLAGYLAAVNDLPDASQRLRRIERFKSDLLVD